MFNVEVLSTSYEWNIEKFTVVLNYRSHLPAGSLALAGLYSSWIAQMGCHKLGQTSVLVSFPYSVTFFFSGMHLCI